MPSIYFILYLGDFELNGHHCTPHEIVFTLRAFGQLNYSPPNSASFFAAIEDVLSSKFTEFDPAALVELLASFVYIERFPVNFIGNIFTPHFVMQIKGWFCFTSTLRFD